jgi:hypothetical protein
MSDNVTGTEIARFASWGVPLLSALGGSIITIVIREFVVWRRRPILKLDFEERKGTKPYILDLRNDKSVAGAEERFKFLRLKLKNEGRRAAMNCEGRIEISDKDDNEILKTTLHWARNDPAIYGEDKLDKVYAPIHLNPKDKEELDVFCLGYCNEIQYDQNSKRFMATRTEPNFNTMSFRTYRLDSQTDYFVKVTVYANNATSKPLHFKVNWDGTLLGFDRAFSKTEKEQTS